MSFPYKISAFLLTATFFAFLITPSLQSDHMAFAQTTQDFTVLVGEQLKNNPVALDILEKIELSKKILKEMQEKKQKVTEQQKFVDEQRRIANERLQADLASMNHKYRDYTPRAAFSNFLTSVNGTHHGIYWDQFNYLDNKIQIARNAMNEVLENGGSYQEARQAYFKFASMTRVEMIQVNQDLNVKWGFADANIQKAFDKYGKLPRSEK